MTAKDMTGKDKTTVQRYDRIAFVASPGDEAQRALENLAARHGNRAPDDADVIVALGGDGLMLRTLHHGGSMAMLGIPPTEVSVDWNQVVFKGLTIKGIYGREMFETWYKMAALLQSGLDVRPDQRQRCGLAGCATTHGRR